MPYYLDIVRLLQTGSWNRNTLRGRLLELGEMPLAISQALTYELLPKASTATSEAKYEVTRRNLGSLTLSLKHCRYKPDFLLQARCSDESNDYAFIVGEVLYTILSSQLQPLSDEYSWDAWIQGLICINFRQLDCRTDLDTEFEDLLRESRNGQPHTEMMD